MLPGLMLALVMFRLSRNLDLQHLGLNVPR
jgi:hypothetical protein